MKKLIAILLSAFVLVAVSAPHVKAQTPAVTSLTSQYYLTVDTVTNTATKYLTYQTAAGVNAPLSGYKKIVTVTFKAVEISGTTGGTAQVQGSLNGTDWYNIGSAYTLTDVASQVTSFTVTDWGAIYLRVAVTGTGTMSDKIYAQFLPRTP
jgi:hypothetical protein